MKIVIWNGNGNPEDRGFEQYLSNFSENLEACGNTVKTFRLRELEIHSCIGCFKCWVKTPGICVFSDDHLEVLQTLISGDFLVFAAPLIMGYPTALLKKTIDRSVPILLPYIDVSSGECRHYLRYGKSPLFGLLYQPEKDTGPDDVEILTKLFKRFSRNACSSLAFVRSMKSPIEEVCSEINNN